MIDFNYELEFELPNEDQTRDWISNCISDYEMEEGEIQYVFCTDDYLHKMNVEFLDHDTLTDVISFDYVMGNLISGDIFISIDRVKDNSNELNIPFLEELNRVIIHGVLHYIGFKDKTDDDAAEMRKQENYCLSLQA